MTITLIDYFVDKYRGKDGDMKDVEKFAEFVNEFLVEHPVVAFERDEVVFANGEAVPISLDGQMEVKHVSLPMFDGRSSRPGMVMAVNATAMATFGPDAGKIRE